MDQRAQGIDVPVAGGRLLRHIYRSADAEAETAVFYQEKFHYQQLKSVKIINRNYIYFFILFFYPAAKTKKLFKIYA